MKSQRDAIKSLLDGLPDRERESLLEEYAPTGSDEDFKLYNMAEAARALGVSRWTLFRMVRDGTVKTVEIREGSRRIPAAELSKFSRNL